jgi:cation:H+ antiporter
MLLLLIAQFVGGLLLLLAGGDALVRGSASIARNMGVPPVVVGLTVVAFGTSAPEFVVAVTSAASDAGGIAFGNVVGASIINVVLILGLTAVIHPLAVTPTIVTRELPMLVLAISAAFVLSLDQYLDSTPNRLARSDGLILCLLFGVFLYYTIMALRRLKADNFVQEAREFGGTLPVKSMVTPVVLVLLGLAGLGLGGNLLVTSAVDIADRFGMSQAMIGLTIVALGTTLPELATSLLAARRGEADLAIGNIVGSNIFNILLVLGVASAITPIQVPARGPLSLAIGLGAAILLLGLINLGGLSLKRRDGFILLSFFAIYLVSMVVFE